MPDRRFPPSFSGKQLWDARYDYRSGVYACWRKGAHANACMANDHGEGLHLQVRGALTTDEQKQKLHENMELEMKKAAAKSGKGDTDVSSQMVDMMASSTTVS